jgi:hypothetical protein
VRIPFLSCLLLSLALLTGCAAQPPETQTPPSTQAPSAQAQPSPPTAPVATPTPTSTPVDTHERTPVERIGAAPASPTAPDRSCKTDSDCAVKDVGNCCGYFPMCVHKNAKTDPAAVQAQCAKSGMGSICGFQEVKGCQCVQGRCENVADGAAVM